MSFPLRTVFKSVTEGTHRVYQNMLWIERMRQAEMAVIDLILEEDPKTDYRAYDRFPNEVNVSNDRDGMKATIVRSIYNKDPKALESSGIADWLDIRYFVDTPITMAQALCRALWLIVVDGEKKDNTPVPVVNRYGKVPTKELVGWLGKCNLSLGQFKHICEIEDVKLGPQNQKRDWALVFHKIDKNLKRIYDALHQNEPQVNVTTFTAPPGHMRFILNEPIGAKGQPESLFEVFSYPIIAIANYMRQNKGEGFTKFESWRGWVNQNVKRLWGGKELISKSLDWFDVGMLCLKPSTAKQMFDCETRPWDDALELLTPYIVKFDREARAIFMNLLHCSGFPGKGYAAFKLAAHREATKENPTMPGVLDFPNTNVLKLAGHSSWAIDTNNLAYIIEASKFLAKSSGAPNFPVPTYTAPTREVSAPKRHKPMPPPKEEKTDYSAAWLLGGAVVIVFAFIRS